MMLLFMFSLVTMETIRIDGCHGDYLKISFPAGGDIATGLMDALRAVGGLSLWQCQRSL